MIHETRECVSKCSSESGYKEFGNYCIKCNNENQYFYFTDNIEKEYVCLDNTISCPSEHPNLVEDYKQCVNDCSETDYYIVYDKKCYKTCDGLANTVVKRVKVDSKDTYQCICTSGLWYKDENSNIKCNLEGKSTCEELISSKTKLVKETEECVNVCPDEYKYYFEYKNECFKNCQDVQKYYGYEMRNDDENKKCKCMKLWELDDNEQEICIKGDYCPKEGNNLLVDGTNQCISECPESDGYIIKYNNTCYKQCPENTQTDTNNENTCICKNKWYKYIDSALNKEII